MYTLGSLILMAILLGAVMPVFNSLTSTLKLDTIIRRLPIIGAHTALAVSILLVWALDVTFVSAWTGDMRSSWMTICVDGCIVYGMVPVKDAIVSFISRGLSGLRAAEPHAQHNLQRRGHRFGGGPFVVPGLGARCCDPVPRWVRGAVTRSRAGCAVL